MTLERDLRDLVAGIDTPRLLENDPVRFARRYTEPADQEIAAFVASGLAYGRVSLFSPVVEALLGRADAFGGPAAYVRGFDADSELGVLEPLYYRWNRGRDHVALFAGLRAILRTHGHLGALVRIEPGEADIGPALSRFVRAIRAAVVGSEWGPPSWEHASRGLKYLLVDPADGSTAKRMAMFARWMVRPSTEGIDLGLWDHVPTRTLVMPVDTHVHRIALLLGLTRRKTANWRTAVDLTRALAAFDPDDPVRFDFAIAHLGISGGCRGRHVATICRDCPIRLHCAAGRHMDNPREQSP